MLIDASSRVNCSENPHKPYIARSYSLWRTFVLLRVSSFIFALLFPTQKILVKPTMKADFSVKLHLRVIQVQLFQGHGKADNVLHDAAK